MTLCRPGPSDPVRGGAKNQDPPYVRSFRSALWCRAIMARQYNMSASAIVPRVAGTFARPGVVRQGWYLVGSSRTLRAGRVRALEIGARRLVLYRSREG